jgi:hypothetical protein
MDPDLYWIWNQWLCGFGSVLDPDSMTLLIRFRIELKCWIRIRIALSCWIRIDVNPDPQPRFFFFYSVEPT